MCAGLSIHTYLGCAHNRLVERIVYRAPTSNAIARGGGPARSPRLLFAACGRRPWRLSSPLPGEDPRSLAGWLDQRSLIKGGRVDCARDRESLQPTFWVRAQLIACGVSPDAYPAIGSPARASPASLRGRNRRVRSDYNRVLAVLRRRILFLLYCVAARTLIFHSVL